MPVYEIVLRESGTSQKVSFATRAITMLGDVVIIDNEHWIVIEEGAARWAAEDRAARLRIGGSRASGAGMSFRS